MTWLGLLRAKRWVTKMRIKFVGTLDVAAIVVGAIVLTIPISIFGLIRVLWSSLWDDFSSWARLKKPVVAQRMRRWAEATEAHIVGQSGRQSDKN